MTAALEDLSQKLLAAAEAAGADAADVLTMRGTSISVEIREGNLEEAKRAEAIDMGLRVFMGQRSAIVSTSDSSDAMIAATAERAVAMAKEATENPYARLADPDEFAHDWDVASLELRDPSTAPTPSALRAMAEAADSAACAVKGVSQGLGSRAAHSDTEICLATSAGFMGAYGRTTTGLSSSAISGEGTTMQRDYDGDVRIFAADLRDPQSIGQRAGERAVAMQGARQAETGTFPVLFDERISSSLIGHLIAAHNGAAIARGGSWLRECIDTPVLPDGMDLIENPHRPRVSGSRPFDGEGLPSQRRDIIRDGVLQNYALDLAAAAQLGMQPNACASRGTASPPSPSTGNLSLTQGTRSQRELIAAMGEGLLVTSLIGSTINPNTGDYSRGASGFWIENGEIAYPVHQVTIAGNLRDMLRRIIPANDAQAHLSRVVPSLLIEGMTLAGA